MTQRKKRVYRRKKKLKPIPTRIQIVEEIIKKNRLALEKGRATVNHKVPDFVNREKKLIIEVELEGRNSQERINGFYKHGYHVVFIHAGYFVDISKGEKHITGMIRSYAE